MVDIIERIDKMIEELQTLKKDITSGAEHSSTIQTSIEEIYNYIEDKVKSDPAKKWIIGIIWDRSKISSTHKEAEIIEYFDKHDNEKVNMLKVLIRHNPNLRLGYKEGYGPSLGNLIYFYCEE